MNLIGLDDGNVTRVSRFANYLRNILPNQDATIMEMGAKAIGRLALAESAITAEYVEFEVKRALEFLAPDKNELKRHAAVLVLRELAIYSPTLFYQSIQQFFENIFGAIRDQKVCAVRVHARVCVHVSCPLDMQCDTKKRKCVHIMYIHTVNLSIAITMMCSAHLPTTVTYVLDTKGGLNTQVPLNDCSYVTGVVCTHCWLTCSLSPFIEQHPREGCSCFASFSSVVGGPGEQGDAEPQPLPTDL